MLSRDGVVRELTEEHAPHKSKVEEEALRQLGMQVDADGYWKGELAVSRVLGDVHQETGAKLAGLPWVCRPRSEHRSGRARRDA